MMRAAVSLEITSRKLLILLQRDHSPYDWHGCHELSTAETKLLEMFSRLSLIPSLVFGLLAGFIAPSFAADHAVILMYHRFGEDQYPSTNVRLEQFEEHLEVLAQGQYNVLPLDDIVAHLQSGEPLPDRTVEVDVREIVSHDPSGYLILYESNKHKYSGSNNTQQKLTQTYNFLVEVF